MNFFSTLQRRMDMLLPPRWQYLSGSIVCAGIYAMFGAQQGDSTSVLIAESAAGLLVGLLVVAGFRYLGRAR